MSEDKLHQGQIVHANADLEKGLRVDVTLHEAGLGSTQLGEGIEVGVSSGRMQSTVGSPDVVARTARLISRAVQTQPDPAPRSASRVAPVPPQRDR